MRERLESEGERDSEHGDWEQRSAQEDFSLSWVMLCGSRVYTVDSIMKKRVVNQTGRSFKPIRNARQSGC